MCPLTHPKAQQAEGPIESGTPGSEAAAGVGAKVGSGERLAARRTDHEGVVGAEVAVLEWTRVKCELSWGLLLFLLWDIYLLFPVGAYALNASVCTNRRLGRMIPVSCFP